MGRKAHTEHCGTGEIREDSLSMNQVRTKLRGGLMALMVGLVGSEAAAQTPAERFSIQREGDVVRVDVPSAKGKTLVLEVQEMLENSPNWNPVLRLNSPEKGRSYYDPVCRVKPSRFFRVSEANDGGLPWAQEIRKNDKPKAR